MKIEDHASGGGPEVVRVRDLRNEPPRTIVDGELYEADDLTPEGQFPQFGYFLCVEDADAPDEERFWECPTGLSAGILEIAEVEDLDVVGAVVDVVSAHKDGDGNWRFQLAVAESRSGLIG